MSLAEQIIDNVPVIFICVIIFLFCCLSFAGIAWAWSMTMMALEPGISTLTPIIKYLQGFQAGVIDMLKRWHTYRRSELDAERNHSRKKYWEDQLKDSVDDSDVIDEE